MIVRTRFAPSPTGYLHVGGLRTALYNFLFTKQKGGKMLLRIEDTDQERLVPGAVEKLISTLKTMGIAYDEGPIAQSTRLALYKHHAEQLVQQGSAYYCFCTRERLDTLRKTQQAGKLPMKYDRECLKLSSAEIVRRITAEESFVIRLKIPDGETVFTDLIRGEIRIQNSEVDDQVLLKSDGFPTYHLAVVVDDHLMEISHVIRGDEWISSVPKHIVLYKAFGWDVPEMAHLPLILNPDRSKLSKRVGDVAVERYLEKGYLVETLINFVALLGFNPKADQELYSMQELIDFFDLSKVNSSGAVFDHAKLDWMNGQYIRKKTPGELVMLCQPFLERAGKAVDHERLLKIVTVEMERFTTLADVVSRVDLYVALPEYAMETLIWKKANREDAITQLSSISVFLNELPEQTFATVELIEAAIQLYIKERSLKNGNVLWPLRVALSASSASASPFQLAWALGKKETINRITHAIHKLKT